MNIEELKQYRKELLKNLEKKYVCVSLNWDDEDFYKAKIKIEGKPLTKAEILNKTNTEEGIKEFEKIMVDIVNQTEVYKYDFDKIYLESIRKFYCEVSVINELISLYKNSDKSILKGALEYYLNNGDIIISNVPINFLFADVVSFYVINEYIRDINKEYDEDEYEEEDETRSHEIFLEGKDIIVNIEEFDNAVKELGYVTYVNGDKSNVNTSYKDLFINAWLDESKEYNSRRVYIADLRNLKKTKKK